MHTICLIFKNRKNMNKLCVVSIIALSVFFVACQKSTPIEEDDPFGKYAKYPYSTLSPEQQKAKLVEESDAILHTMSSLPNEEGIQLIKMFMKLVDISNPDPKLVIDLNKTQFNVSDCNGEYSWNTTKKNWTFNNHKESIVFNFPSTVNGTTNNAKLELSGVGSGNLEEIEDIKIELPQKLKMVLSKGSTTVASIEINATEPNLNDFAKAANLNMTLGSYVITAGANKDGKSKINSTFKFAKENDIILNAILSSTINIYETLDVTFDYQSIELYIGSTLAIVGYVDVIKNQKEFDAINNKYYKKYGSPSTWTDDIREAKLKEEVAVWNKNAKLYLISTQEKYKIADMKMSYSVKKDCSDYEGTKYCQTEISTDLLLIFNDETEVSAAVFFSDVFNEVFEAWINFLKQF